VTGEEPISVSAQTFKQRPEAFTDCDEITTYQLQFPGGAVANLETGFHVGFNYLKVRAEDGFFELDPFSTYGGIKGRSTNGDFDFPDVNQQKAQMDEVAECIIEGKPMRVTGEEGLRDMIVVDAIYRSMEEGGKTISISNA
jgi:glucose-fructose oxidoreductase